METTKSIAYKIWCYQESINRLQDILARSNDENHKKGINNNISDYEKKIAELKKEYCKLTK